LLPLDLLSIASRDGHLARAVPRYLTPRDEVWVRAVLDLFDGYVGRSVAERAAELPDRVRAIAREHGVYARAADGLAHVLARRFKSKVAGRLEPIEVRRVVFEEAGRDAVFDRTTVLQRAAMRLSATADEAERALFADRPGARQIDALAAPLPPLEAIEAYNLALVQGILLRSERVVVEVKEHLHAVVRFAKLAGLLCTCAFGERGTRLEISGPLAILRHTTKYGFALASFFPAVVSTAGFRLEARCLLRGEPIVVHVDATDRLARTHKLPRDADSAVERALARDVRRLNSAWTLTREANAIDVGNRLFFPDFTLRRDGDLVLVEIVGFYTPEYLRSKLEALRAARSHMMIVCIDESLACADGAGEIVGKVLRYERRVDARALINVAEEMVSTANG
jgi:predicted nuclease of restriction endonuclease-like RecB superfamily